MRYQNVAAPFAMKAALILLCIAIFAFDLLYRRVPNRLLLLAIVLQISVLLVLGRGWNGLTPLQSLAGFGLGFVTFFPLYLLRAMGAGDVKFFAVLGLLLGAVPLLPVWLIGSALALLHALSELLSRSAISPWLHYAGAQLGRTPLYPLYCRLRELRGSRNGIPYAAYLATGAAAVVLAV